MNELRYILGKVLDDMKLVDKNFQYTMTFKDGVYVKIHVGANNDLGDIVSTQVYFVLEPAKISENESYHYFYNRITQCLRNEFVRREYITCGSL